MVRAGTLQEGVNPRHVIARTSAGRPGLSPLLLITRWESKGLKTSTASCVYCIPSFLVDFCSTVVASGWSGRLQSRMVNRSQFLRSTQRAEPGFGLTRSPIIDLDPGPRSEAIRHHNHTNGARENSIFINAFVMPARGGSKTPSLPMPQRCCQTESEKLHLYQCPSGAVRGNPKNSIFTNALAGLIRRNQKNSIFINIPGPPARRSSKTPSLSMSHRCCQTESEKLNLYQYPRYTGTTKREKLYSSLLFSTLFCLSPLPDSENSIFTNRQIVQRSRTEPAKSQSLSMSVLCCKHGGPKKSVFINVSQLLRSSPSETQCLSMFWLKG